MKRGRVHLVNDQFCNMSSIRSIMDRFEKVRKRLRNESSDEDSEEERKKTKGSQYEMMKRKMEKKLKNKQKTDKIGGEKEKKNVEQYSMYSKRWRSEGQRKKAMEREEERWMQNIMRDNLKYSRDKTRSRSRSRERRRSTSRGREGRSSRRRSISRERSRYSRRDEVKSSVSCQSKQTLRTGQEEGGDIAGRDLLLKTFPFPLF